jgi:hypothetical protein
MNDTPIVRWEMALVIRVQKQAINHFVSFSCFKLVAPR